MQSLFVGRAHRYLTKTAVLLGVGVTLFAAPMQAAVAETSIKVAVLSATLQNDHAQWVPTTDAERNRLTKIEDIFKSSLEASGKYKFVPLSAAIQEKVGKDQKMGECGGCELTYGKEVNADQVAWIEVQKVSELILNINVYMKDVKSGDAVFTKSVDLRGNNDEAWNHSMKFLIKRYLLAADTQ